MDIALKALMFLVLEVSLWLFIFIVKIGNFLTDGTDERKYLRTNYNEL